MRILDKGVWGPSLLVRATCSVPRMYQGPWAENPLGQNPLYIFPTHGACLHVSSTSSEASQLARSTRRLLLRDPLLEDDSATGAFGHGQSDKPPHAGAKNQVP